MSSAALADAFSDQVTAFGIPGVGWHAEVDGVVLSTGGVGVRAVGSEDPVNPAGAGEYVCEGGLVPG
jgi:hypothetical protein